MKIFLFLIVLFGNIFASSFPPLSLEKRVLSSSTILTGKVISVEFIDKTGNIILSNTDKIGGIENGFRLIISVDKNGTLLTTKPLPKLISVEYGFKPILSIKYERERFINKSYIFLLSNNNTPVYPMGFYEPLSKHKVVSSILNKIQNVSNK